VESNDAEAREAMELASRFGRTVRFLRIEKGISQEAFADLCGIHRTAMSTLERGVHVVSLHVAYKAAKALGMPLSELLRWSEGEVPGPVDLPKVRTGRPRKRG
jgi:transcriptional regulator with XRE-family HTH domain